MNIKRMKRLLSVALSVFVFASAFGFTAVADSGEEAVCITEEETGLLKALGIVEESDNAALDSQVSRAEFAVYIVRFANAENILSSSDGRFKDVLKDSYEEPYVYTAVDNKLMAPVAENYFYPRYPITSAEAAQAFVMSLGYTGVANEGNTYLTIANRLDLFDGMDTDGAFTKDKLFRMLFNALHAETFEYVSIGNGEATYSKSKAYDALEKFFGIKHSEGIIIAAGGVELGAGYDEIYNSKIKHNGRVYNFEYSSISEYLGRNAVVYYYKSDDVIGYVLRDGNNVLSLDADDINSYKDLQYEYGDNDKKIRIEDPYVIYNGEEYTDVYTDKVMIPDEGTVTLIDNDNNGIYDWVLIEAFEDYVVKSKLYYPNSIISTDGDQISLDSQKYEVTVYNASGKIADFNSVPANVTVSVALSARRAVVYQSDKTVSGKISLVYSDYSGEKWKIGEESYSLSPTLVKKIKNNKTEKPETDTDYTFYLNKTGKIVYYTKGTTSEGLGRFYAIMAQASRDDFSGDVTLKIFSKEQGGFSLIECASKVMLNGETKSASAVYDALKKNGIDGASSGEIVAQPVKISLNADGKINYLSQYGSSNSNADFTYYMGSSTTTGRVLAYRNILEIFSKDMSTADAPYFTVNGQGGCMQIGFDSNTVSYQVPIKSDGTIDGTKEDMFLAKSITMPSQPRFYAYREDDDLTSSLVLQLVDADAKENCGNDFDIKVVRAISTEYMDDEEVTAIDTNNGKYYIKSSNINLDALQLFDYSGNPRTDERGNALTYKVQPGDLVNISIDATGFISAIEAVYDARNMKLLGSGSDSFSETRYQARNEGFMLTRTELLSKQGSFIKATTGSASNFVSGTDKLFLTIMPTDGVVVSKSRSRITTSTASGMDYIGYEDTTEDYAVCIFGSRYMQLNGTKVPTFIYRYSEWKE